MMNHIILDCHMDAKMCLPGSLNYNYFRCLQMFLASDVPSMTCAHEMLNLSEVNDFQKMSGCQFFVSQIISLVSR